MGNVRRSGVDVTDPIASEKAPVPVPTTGLSTLDGVDTVHPECSRSVAPVALKMTSVEGVTPDRV